MQPGSDAARGLNGGDPVYRQGLAIAMGEAARALAAAEAGDAASRALLAAHQHVAGDAVVDRLSGLALEAAAATARWTLQGARERFALAQARILAAHDGDTKRHLLVLQQVQALRREFADRLAGIETTKAQLRGVAKWLTGRGDFVAAALATEMPGAIDPETQSRLAAIEAAAFDFAGA